MAPQRRRHPRRKNPMVREGNASRKPQGDGGMGVRFVVEIFRSFQWSPHPGQIRALSSGRGFDSFLIPVFFFDSFTIMVRKIRVNLQYTDGVGTERRSPLVHPDGIEEGIGRRFIP
jgi:hypothetical protein